MNKYEVTRGALPPVEVEAANKREAARRAQDDPTRVAVERIPGDIPAGAESPKRRYKVTWGDQEWEVVAVHKDDAWSQCVGNNTDSMLWKFPNLHERIIEDLGPVESDGPQAAPGGEDDENGVTSPVADLNAAEAKDSISRMHSAEKLQDIIDADKRSTVVAAAQDRLTEIGGS